MLRTDSRNCATEEHAGTVDGIRVYVRRTGRTTWRIVINVSGCVIIRPFRQRSGAAAWEAAAREVKALRDCAVTMGHAEL